MEIEYWHWLTLGTLLLILELMTGTMNLIWPALAALAVGGLVAAEPMAWYSQVLLFSGFSVVSTVFWKILAKGRLPKSDKPTLNRPAGDLIGRRIAIGDALESGRGRALVDGVWWQVVAEESPDEALEGAELEGDVVRVEGASLVVRISGR